MEKSRDPWKWLKTGNNATALGPVLVVLGLAITFAIARSNKKDKKGKESAQTATTSSSQGNIIINADGDASISGISLGGVSPKTVDRLNELLDEKDKQLGEADRSQQEKDEVIKEWIKNYNEVKTRLEGSTDELSIQAKQLFEEGDYKKAGEVLDQTLKIQDEQTASNHYTRGKIWELEFEFLKAAPHYEKAYNLKPHDPDYAHSHAVILYKQNQFSRAEEPFNQALKAYRELAESNPAAYRPVVATTLNNLASLYGDTQKFKEAESAYDEAIEIRRELVARYPEVYGDDLAQTLLGLAWLYEQSDSPSKGCAFASEAEEKAQDEQLKQSARDYLSEHC